MPASKYKHSNIKILISNQSDKGNGSTNSYKIKTKGDLSDGAVVFAGSDRHTFSITLSRFHAEGPSSCFKVKHLWAT